ncbi:MFS transporter [Conexibacter stalactiti]|uniref:MFS transporter n=1 Tax=Conexibacter stalactiti TaxID=1940611 RepID=A0ABU4HMW8_9ACTN|nr:MFS transporter [Conexibacter stalactiti]MDW5594624.1 MFS transporter [Conexibacter stalactiti]MEC5035266.1 MFS transporter [Conexibacter stalactiti]
MQPVPSTPGAARPAPDPRRWWLLAIVAVAELMIILDIYIVNIALPSAQTALEIPDANRHWVVTAYSITFGGLLLLGGRIGDYWGRKRTFALSLAGFGLASALGGAASSQELLFAARALQGAFAALMAPAILSLLFVTFTDPRERAKAFGVWGGVAGTGSAIGLLLGGVFTEYASWRWTLLVNVPVALVLAGAAWWIVSESRAEGETRYDVPGALTSTLGVTALVYGFTRAEGDGWGAPVTVALLVAGVGLLALFVAIERRSSHPLLPLRVLTDRNRAGSFAGNVLFAGALFSYGVFLVYYLQGSRGYSAIESGCAIMPLAVAAIAFVSVGARLLPRVGPRPLTVVGFAIGAAGLALLALIGEETSYAAVVLPGLVLLGVAAGLVWPVLSNTALIGVRPRDAGAASGMVNVSQQLGGALTVAFLNTIAAGIAERRVERDGGGALAQGLIDGYATTFAIAAGLMALGAVVSLLTITTDKRLLGGAAEEVADDLDPSAAEPAVASAA